METVTDFTCMKCGRSSPVIKPPNEEYEEPICQSCRYLPSVGPNRPTRQWDEYDQLKQAVNDYLKHDPDDPKWDDIWRALGAIMGEYQRDRFVDAYDVDEPAEKACIGRLINGSDECPHNVIDRDDDPKAPPHKPPASDHATLWLDNGEPAVFSMHVYQANIERLDSNEPPHNLWFDMFQFARRHGLEVSVHPVSWYNIGRTVQVTFYGPERFR